MTSRERVAGDVYRRAESGNSPGQQQLLDKSRQAQQEQERAREIAIR